VIVLERAKRVGGQIWTGAASPLRTNWARIAEFYQRQADKRQFDVRLNTEATRQLIEDLKPDAVVIATGSSPNRLHLRGESDVLTVHEVIAGRADQAKRAVIYDREGFNRPLVAADYLSARGVRVDLVSPLPTIGGLVEGMMLEEMVDQLTRRGVQFRPDVELDSWAGGIAGLHEVQSGRSFQIDKVDAIVATIGSTSVAVLADQLRDIVNELHVIGDAHEPQTVEAATYQGALLARAL
jgi:pyruvate/2-oxoglutarate dehydrogenase complex dihydrolipoamide dehydrogenase (E3) component